MDSDARVGCKVVNDASTSYRLSPEQLAEYHRDGFLLIRNLFSAPALECYRQRFVDICQRKVTGVMAIKDFALYRKGANPEEYINKIQELVHDEVFCTYSENPLLLDIVSQIIGDDISILNSTLINKPPGSNEHSPHQDAIYIPFRPLDKIVGVWTALEHTTRENGCMFFIPGSHKEPLYAHEDRESKRKPLFYSLRKDSVAAAEKKRVDIIMEPGDTVLIHPLVIHGSRANVSDRYRKAITCHYWNTTCVTIDTTGTPHELLVRKAERLFRNNGVYHAYQDVLLFKSKQLRSSKSKL